VSDALHIAIKCAERGDSGINLEGPDVESSMPIKVFLAEDNASLRKVVADLLREDQELSLIGQAETFAETLQQLELLPADVLLLDLHMPDERDFVLQFLDAQLAKRTPCVLAMSMSIDEEAKEKALVAPWASPNGVIVDMPQWNLTCRSCEKRFPFAKIESSGMGRYDDLWPPKPEWPEAGLGVLCPHCGNVSTYLRHELIYSS
jgi:CheY-like chemotaxis protein